MSQSISNAESATPQAGDGSSVKRAILILGMHRSGTSALTKVLNLCGLDLPAVLVPGREDNERGFFEPGKVIGIHEEMFRTLGSSWDDVLGIPREKLTGGETADFRQRLLEALREDLGDSRQFVLKDPRFCRLLPMWRLILAEFGAQPSCILTIRNPLDVAASLEARDGFAKDKSMVLWLRHFLDAERDTRDLPRNFTSYDALLEDWRTVVGRIDADLGLGLGPITGEAEKAVGEFLEPSLRHHAHGEPEWEKEKVFGLVRRAYDWSMRAVAGEAVDVGELDEIGREFDLITTIFAPQIREQAAQKRAVDEARAAAASQVEAAQQRVAEVEVQIADANSKLADAGRINSELNASHEAAKAQTRDLRGQVESLRSQLAETAESVARTRAELGRGQAEIERQREQMRQQAAELEKQQAELSRGRASAARLAEEVARAQQLLENQRASEAQLRESMAPKEKELAIYKGQVQRIQSSLSWRATAPLRYGQTLAQRYLPTRGPATNGMSKGAFKSTRRRIAASGLFDAGYYLSRYPEVGAARIDPLDHYVLYGAAEGRDPHPLFHSGFYLRKYPEVAVAKMNPLLHYVDFGGRERRSPNQLFDSNYYLEKYPDVAAAGVNPLHHYCDAGWTENRSPHPLFDGAFYLRRYPEVAKAKLNPLLHYLRWGQSERRSPNAWFDTRWYLERYPDVAAAGMDALEHYLLRGAIEGRDAGPIFCTDYYLKEHPWLRAEGINPLVHWVNELAAGAARQRYWNRPTPLRRNLRTRNGDAPALLGKLKHQPLISILVPTFNTPPRYLQAAVDSVRAQTYPNWELCICDDGSSDESTRAAIKELEHSDPDRIRVTHRLTNGGISRASNDALATARGEFVAMLDHDDEILPGALLKFVQAINEDPAVDVLYSDQAFLSADGLEEEPLLKPDWSPRLFWGVMFVGHLLMVRRELASKVGGFDPQFDNVQDFEFMLRLGEKTKRIKHIPEILYYWRRVHGSVSRQADAKSGIPALQTKAVNAHLERMKVTAVAENEVRHAHRLMVGPRKNMTPATASVFVRPCGDAAALQRCLDSIFSRTKYSKFEVFVAGEGIGAGDVARFGGKVKILGADPLVGTLADAKQVAGDFWVSLSSELEVISADWLEQMVFAAGLPGAMYVCPLVLQPDGGTVDEAGVILGMNGSVGPAMKGWLAESDGHAGSLTCLREVSAVSDWCVGASREHALMRAADEDVYKSDWYRMAHRSARLAGKEWANLYVPRAVVRRTMPVVSGQAAEARRLDAMLFADLWHRAIEKGDPYHNLNFSRVGSGYL